jgi:hypothetical protein
LLDTEILLHGARRWQSLSPLRGSRAPVITIQPQGKLGAVKKIERLPLFVGFYILRGIGPPPGERHGVINYQPVCRYALNDTTPLRDLQHPVKHKLGYGLVALVAQ